MLSVTIVGIAAFVLMIGIVLWAIWRARKIDLTGTPPGEKPEWMRTTIPEASAKAQEADHDPLGLYDYDTGEKLGPPFAEQIEDMVNFALQQHPELKQVSVDFGTARGGGVEIHIGEQVYANIADIPDQRVRRIILDAVKKYNKLP